MSEADLILSTALVGLVVSAALFIVVYRHHRGRATLRAVVLGNALLLSTMLILLFCAGEVYYRFLHDQTDAYHISLVSNRWIERHYRLNNFGMRDDIDYTREIGSGKLRITVLGDSFTNGHGVERVKDRFANRLRSSRPEWEIQLLAADGMDTGPHITALRQALADGYRTDIVLYAYGLNDIGDLIPELDSATRRLYRERIGFLVQHSYLLNTYYYRYRIARDPALRGYFERLLQAYDGPEWTRQQARLSELQMLVSQADARLLVATFPFYEVLDEPRFQAVHRKLAAFWSANGVPHLDLAPAYGGMPAASLIVNRHDSHPNEAAHAVAAAELELFLLSQAGSGDPVPAADRGE